MVTGIYNNKGKYLTYLTVGIACLLFCCVSTDTPVEFIKKIISYTVTITSASVYFFNRWIWKWMPEVWTGIPNLNGTWKGKLEYRWAINPDKSNEIKEGSVEPVFLVIKQTFLSIKILIFTGESRSLSSNASISLDETGAWKLSYLYDNTPDLAIRERSQRHRGAAELMVNKGNYKYHLQGDYWTDRWSQGKMKFFEYKHRHAIDYYSSLEIYKESQ
ncbi:MAG: hypothetical protein K2Q34_00760 [Alphaproteobacteria bacterium]|nr:hypothetical protein [Alphaproteobacteria bacterium]